MASRSRSRRLRYRWRVLAASLLCRRARRTARRQQRLHARREDGVAGVDGELAVTKLVGKADLPKVGMVLLSTERVRPLRRLSVPLRRPGLAAAARALPGVVFHARHHGVDPRQLDLVIAAWRW